MPGVTLHFLLADRALDAWRREASPPFDSGDPEALNAFYHGAVGPDLGYFPGGERLLSDLAHCVRSGALARYLVASARTASEKAFAWGWLTHYLADGAIHPIIGRGVGEVLTGNRHHFVDGASAMGAHVQVETGLDAWLAERAPLVRQRRLRDAFDAHGIRFLARAYSAVYGVSLDFRLFLRSHRATTRRVGQALATMGLLSLLAGASKAKVPSLVRQGLRRAYEGGVLPSVVFAYLNPIHPAGWLLREVKTAMDAFPASFLEQVQSGARRLRDVNLDTGRPLTDELHHEGARRAREGLARLASESSPARVLPGVLGQGALGRRLVAVN